MKSNTDINVPWIETFIISVIVLVLFANVLLGPIRYYLAGSGAKVAIYIPQMAMGAVILVAWIMRVSKGDIPLPELIVYVILIVWLILGVLQLHNGMQVALGVYMLLPLLFFGSVAGLYLRRKNFFLMILFCCWSIAVLGLFLDYFESFPWSGFSYQIGDVQVEANREWTTGSFRRLSGFSRASFEAASQVFFFGMLLCFNIKNKIIVVTIWFLCLAGVVLTTTKGLILAWIFATFIYFTKKAFGLRHLSFIPYVLALLMVVLPFLSIIFDFRGEQNDPLFELVFSSMTDRLVETWPQAFKLVSETGAGSFLWGRGIGGVGNAQVYFEPNRFSPGDNFFMYLYATYGVLALFIVGLITKISVNCTKQSVQKDSFYVYQTLVAFMVFGLTTNMVESLTLDFFLVSGVMAGYQIHRKNLLANGDRMRFASTNYGRPQ